MLGLTVASRDTQLLWSVEPDTWGSDHSPIRLTSTHSDRQPARRHKRIHWNTFRLLLDRVSDGEHLTMSIQPCLEAATKTVTVSSRPSVPDQKYFNLRATHRRAQCHAFKRGTRNTWSSYNKANAEAPQYVLRLQRNQRHKFCESVYASTSCTKIWRIVQSALSPTAVQNPFACIALATDRTLLCHPNNFAAEFTRPTRVPNVTD